MLSSVSLASLAAGFGKVHTHFNADSCMLAMPFDPQGYNSERMRTHLLLLAIAADQSLGQYHGGYYQLWITPADLQARRFDRVELTFDSR